LEKEMKSTHSSMSKDQALDILVSRIEKRFPGVDTSAERKTLAHQSRASLLHSVGAQLYGDPGKADKQLMDYAYAEMTAAEQREIQAGG
jgi:hypothetical protein